MPSPFFRFKQFTVFHDRCAMKVGTDGVLLGVWATTDNVQSALDIGCGSGLISLMIAQRNRQMLITAIDVDADAIAQSIINVDNSPFKQQIDCRRIALQDFADECRHKFDLIVSNPPYFTESLKSPDDKRNTARHTDSLPVKDLMSNACMLLADTGTLAVVFPADSKKLLLSTGECCGLYASRITNVYPTPHSAGKRILVEFCKDADATLVEDELIIEQERHVYSHRFGELAKDFYLKL